MLKVLAVFSITTLFGFLSQTNSPNESIDPWVTVLQWGPAGVVLILLASGQLRFGREIKVIEERFKEEKESRVKAENDRDLVNTKTVNEFIPLLTEATQLLAGFRPSKTATDHAVAIALADIAEKLDQIDRK